MTISYIAGLQWMPLADALAIVFLYPMLVVCMSAIFLREKVGIRRWLAVSTGFLGVCLVIRPGFETLNPGAPLVFLAAIFTATYTILTRKLKQRYGTLSMLFYPAFIGAILITPLAIGSWKTPSMTHLSLMISIGGIAALAHFLIIVAYARCEASLVVPIAYFQIVIGITLGLVIFGDFPSPATWAGITVIVSSGLFISRRDTLNNR
ncbi:MAG: drug/metabolite transporter (DMT)-like permease [Gammaproteobacteria bacterium]|jgi:drug/metabolite transporter (DMT)-like permease